MLSFAPGCPPLKRTPWAQQGSWTGWIWQLCWVWLLTLGVVGPAHAQDQVLERAWLEDATGSLSLSQVQAQPVTVFQGLLIRGYSASTFWVRLRIAAAPADSAPLMLRLQPGYLDEIELYDPLQPGPPPRTGDREPPGAQGYALLAHGFLIPADTQPRTLWLRVRSTSTVLLQAELLPLPQAIATERVQTLWAGLYIGVMTLFLAWAVAHWLARREGLIAVFAASQAVALLYALAFLGYLRLMAGDTLPAPWVDMATSTLILISTATNFWFHGRFLQEFRPHPWARRLLQIMLLLALVDLLRLAFGEVRLALQLNKFLILLGPLLFLVTALSSRVWRQPLPGDAPPLSRRSLGGLYLLLLGLMLLLALPAMGWQGSTLLTLQGWPIWGFVSGTLVVISLELRARQMRRVHQMAKIELRLSRQQVEHERQQRQQQAQFMAMLTHELKTPLTVVSMATRLMAPEARERTDRAIQDMTAVIDRCAQAERLHDPDTPLQLSPIDLPAELNTLQLSLSKAQAERVRIDLQPGLPAWQGDLQLLRTVLGNLLDNALKYGDPHAAVHVQAFPEARGGRAGVCIRVANAPGRVGWPDPERVFQKYYRSAGAHSSTGSGLGLYLAHVMAQRLGGELRYAPDAQSVRFECWLPV